MKQKVEGPIGGFGVRTEEKKRKEKKCIADKLHQVLGSYKLIRLQQLVTNLSDL